MGRAEIVSRREVRLSDRGVSLGVFSTATRGLNIEWTSAEVWEVMNMASLDPA
jgi:hypothetical protein